VLVGLALDEETSSCDDLALLFNVKLDTLKLLVRQALGIVEVRRDSRVLQVQVVQTLAGRLYSREARDARQKPFGPTWLVEPEAVYERAYRSCVEKQGREHDAARHRDERLTLRERLGKGEREGERYPAA
jgi:hypothetical protein